jgi:hypothetical protein
MEQPNNIQLTYIVVASDGSQYVQKSEYDKVKQENYELHTKIFNLTANQQTLHDTIKNRDEIILARDKTIEELQKENDKLKIRIKELEDKIINLELDNKLLNNKVDKLERDKEIFDGLVKLHECNALVNNVFKYEYRKYFKKGDYEYAPNIDEFIRKPPTDNTRPDYIFWNEYLTKYPCSDDKQFRVIYNKINNDRSLNGSHVDVSLLTEDEFDNLIQLVYPEDYQKNKQLYVEYRQWLYGYFI